MTILIFAFVAACQRAQPTPPPSTTNSRTPVVDARRSGPPSSLATTALRVGVAAPEIALDDGAGAPWTLSEARAKHARVMLVFYRGDW